MHRTVFLLLSQNVNNSEAKNRVIVYKIDDYILFSCHYFMNTHDQFGVLCVRTGKPEWASLKAD